MKQKPLLKEKEITRDVRGKGEYWQEKEKKNPGDIYIQKKKNPIGGHLLGVDGSSRKKKNEKKGRGGVSFTRGLLHQKPSCIMFPETRGRVLGREGKTKRRRGKPRKID